MASDTGISMVLLPFEELPAVYVRNGATARTIDLSEYEIAEKLLMKAIHAYNEERSEKFVEYMSQNPDADWTRTDIFIEPEKYYRQYIPYTNGKGERCLWINFFRHPVGNWLEHRVSVEGGGNSFFSIGLNMDTGKRFDFRTNEE
ncbi:hypothetical protein J5839_04290 [Methanosarcinaceae archaeon]|nr:hypothetical protein [Methanosarcinaceae archaeon]